MNDASILELVSFLPNNLPTGPLLIKMAKQLPLILCLFLISYVYPLSWPWANDEIPLPDALSANLWDFTPDERRALSSGRDSLGIHNLFLIS
jgi:hypothetical protein